MTRSTANSRGPRRASMPLAARRITLLASIAGIGAALLLAGPNGYWPLAFGAATASAADATLQHPIGFSDIVAKVKPAVISVRVKIPGCAEPAMMQERRRRSAASPGCAGLAAR